MTLPELHLDDWRATKDTLHLASQIVGKMRMAVAPPRNHWWHVTLYVDARGLTTRRLRHRGTTFEIRFDLVDHALVIDTADGRSGGFILADGLSIAEFDARIHDALADLEIDVEIEEEPFGLAITTPFAADSDHRSWDGDAVQRFGRVLGWSDAVLDEFAGWFCGKTSPVHLFWHGFDLALSRFSGRRAPAIDADRVTREAYSHETISFGFWAGDDRIPDAAYYSYTAPEPEGLRDQRLPAGEWVAFGSGSLAFLPYETVRTAPDPRATLLGFLQGAYEAGARLAGWDTGDLASAWCPAPSRLEELRTAAEAATGRAPAPRPVAR
jgi:hypothetical protein